MLNCGNVNIGKEMKLLELKYISDSTFGTVEKRSN